MKKAARKGGGKGVSVTIVEPIAKGIIENRGLRQNWVVEQMNRIAPDLNMSPVKFSAIICGDRRMTGDELIAFCIATGTNPEHFCKAAQDTTWREGRSCDRNAGATESV